MSHTPGPWWNQEGTPQIFGAPGKRGGHWCVANTLAIPNADSETEANARLIAAAPELLEALKALVDAIEDSGGHDENGDLFDIEKACAAIAKAEGGAK